METFGWDQAHRWVRLPNTLEEYYNGAAKRFAGIEVLRIRFTGEEGFRVSAGTVEGDFALLRAFLADHEGRLHVVLETEHDKAGPALYFPSYHYGFVEDTFARAIHHKIEGIGYACRECVGKYELRLREYDRLFRLASEEEMDSAIWMALYRLNYPWDLATVHQEVYEAYLKEFCEETLLLLADYSGERMAWIDLLTSRELLSDKAIDRVLPGLSRADQAPMVAALLKQKPRKSGRKRLVL